MAWKGGKTQERGVFCCINSKLPRSGVLRNVTSAAVGGDGFTV